MCEYQENIIIDYARQAIKDVTPPNSSEKNISELTKYSRAIIEKWQTLCENDLQIKNAIKVTIWHPKNRELGFSVYDSNKKTAYELKVSCKNPRNQFYKAICKALLMNSLPNQGKSIKKLIFMVSSEGEKNLYGTENGSPGNSLPAQMCQMRKLGFKIKIVKINSIKASNS